MFLKVLGISPEVPQPEITIWILRKIWNQLRDPSKLSSNKRQQIGLEVIFLQYVIILLCACTINLRHFPISIEIYLPKENSRRTFLPWLQLCGEIIWPQKKIVEIICPGYLYRLTGEFTLHRP